ncbi:MAG: sensor histidine kinase [Desulfobacteraceae bacterium]|nr:MAG: sensor histidine kinase [Desulfobacteraceae bacterium]
MQILNPSKWYLHPVFIFTCSIFALATFLVLTVSWYMEITSALEVIILKFHIDPQLIFPSKTGMTILALTALIIVVLAGILLAFIYYQKTVQVFRLQHNFIYNFTHELKTPVTSLRIYLETFIRHELEPKDIQKYSENMLKDIDRLTENINSILDLARVESGIFGTPLKTESLIDIVEEFCRQNSSLFRDCQIQIENPEGYRFRFPVNRFLFEMLLMNIISNAIKYNDSKTPELRIVFGSHLQKITMDFIDNGIGIKQHEIKKIFRKFYQVGPEDNLQMKSSGLGLYLVSSIARIHGWKVLAASEGVGKGARFTLSVPRASIANLREKNLWKMLKKSASWS